MFNITQKNKKGFTLIEVLVVITILSIIMVFGITVISTVLNGGTKIALVSQIKQNGNYVTEVMSRYIRNATSISNAPACGNSLVLVQPDNSEVTFSLLPSDANNNNRIASNSAILTNSDIKNGVNVSSLNFTCDTTVNPPVVTINFTLTQPLSAGSGVESQSSETFHTSVSLRTY